MAQKRHVMHGRDHLPWGADPIPLLAGEKFKPHGIFGGGSQSPPDPDSIGYLPWQNTNFGVVTSGSSSAGEFATVSAASYDDGTFSSDRATYPEVFCFIEAPGIYLCSIHVAYQNTEGAAPSGVVDNFLQWSPGGYLDGGGGSSYSEYQHEYHDLAAFPNSYKQAVLTFHRDTVLYVQSSITPEPCNRFRAHSTWAYESLAVSGAVWKIGDWS